MNHISYEELRYNAWMDAPPAQAVEVLGNARRLAQTFQALMSGTSSTETSLARVAEFMAAFDDLAAVNKKRISEYTVKRQSELEQQAAQRQLAAEQRRRDEDFNARWANLEPRISQTLSQAPTEELEACKKVVLSRYEAGFTPDFRTDKRFRFEVFKTYQTRAGGKPALRESA